MAGGHLVRGTADGARGGTGAVGTDAAPDALETAAPVGRLGYRPELDGLRAVAVAAVIGYHAGLPGFSGGHVGVIWFFVLSGFLITTLLLEERDVIGDIDLRRFYQRRALRLLPSLYLMLGVFAIAAVTILTIEGSDFASAGLYFSNMHALVFGVGSVNVFFLHTWSLSLEEQFYLVWPLALPRLRSARSAVGLAFALVAIAFVARFFDHDANPLLTLPLFAMDAFVIGALLAVGRRRNLLARRLLAPWVTAVAVAVMAFDVMVSHEAVHGWLPLRMLVSQIAVAVVILRLVADREWGLGVFFARRWMVYVGLLSYALYLWHYPIFIALHADRQPDMPGIVRHLLKYSLTVVAAVGTYHLVERPLARRRSRLAARRMQTIS